MERFGATWTETSDRYLGVQTEGAVQSNLTRSSLVGRQIGHRALRDGAEAP